MIGDMMTRPLYRVIICGVMDDKEIGEEIKDKKEKRRALYERSLKILENWRKEND